MLRIKQTTSPEGAKSYFKTSDYYTNDQERPGFWRGQAAEQLGLAGQVVQADWESMCENRNPTTNKPLTSKTVEGRRVGWDFSFHAPKGLSVLYAETKNEVLVETFQNAVNWTMNQIEAEAKVRVRKDDQDTDRTSGNLAWGEFTHFTTRPVNGVPDPHLHVHCFAFNASEDPVEAKWKAAAIHEIMRDAPYFEAMFHAKLTEDLGKLGLPIVRTKAAWDFENVTPELVDKFSRRTAEIEELATKLKIVDPKLKDKLGATTRAKKSKQFTFDELSAQWHERLTPGEKDTLKSLADRMGGEPTSGDPSAAKIALDQSLEHLLSRKSVVPERMVIARALKLAVGKATIAEVYDELDRSGVIRGKRDGRDMVTTRKVLGEEMSVLKFAREGRGTCTPIERKVNSFKRDWLNADQKAAIKHILQSRDRVMLVRGAAGVGKTSLMQEAVDQINDAGMRVIALAPSADASRGVMREANFHDADTVARFLLDEKFQEKAKGQLIWVDEASLLGAESMAKPFTLADELECRVLLTGDRAQHGSVDRGTMLKLLETDAGITPASVTEIQRQTSNYKEAVKLLSEDNVLGGFDRLSDMGWVREVKGDERDQQLARAYVETLDEGLTALAISPTKLEGAKITHEIREKLKATGKLSKDEREFVSLANLHRTEAERQDALSYSAGEVVQFHQNAKGFVKGERLIVADFSALPTDQAKRFAVFKQEKVRLAVGDLIRITANGKTLDEAHRLNNGSVYRVKSFDEQNNIVLDNNWKVARDFGHIDHGYVLTSHASQGKTVKRVFVAQSSQSFAASNRQQFYVSVSRGERQAVIFTDSKDDLREAIEKTDDRISATEFVNGPRVAEIIRLNQRNMERDVQIPDDLRKVASYER